MLSHGTPNMRLVEDALMSLVESRQRLIKSRIEERGSIRIDRLAEELHVSAETVRRDLKALEDARALRRVRGGAVTVTPMDIGRLGHRLAVRPDEKRRIGRLAAGLVVPGQSIFLGAGSSGGVAMAEALADGAACHVLTASLAVARVLGASGRHEVSLTGGNYDARHDALRGPGVFAAIEDRFFDAVFFGAHGVDPVHGVVDAGEFQCRLQRLLASRARRYVLLADQSKFGRIANFRTLPLEAVDMIVTDASPDATTAARMRELGVELVIAR